MIHAYEKYGQVEACPYLLIERREPLLTRGLLTLCRYMNKEPERFSNAPALHFVTWVLFEQNPYRVSVSSSAIAFADLRRRRAAPATPASPVPRSTIVVGPGTGPAAPL